MEVSPRYRRHLRNSTDWIKMTLPLTTGNENQTFIISEEVLRRVSSDFNPDGSISFEGFLCERKKIEGKIIDINWQKGKTSYPDQQTMIRLAVATWAPSQTELDALAEQIKKGPEYAVSAILSGFVEISKSAIQAILNPPPEEVELTEEEN